MGKEKKCGDEKEYMSKRGKQENCAKEKGEKKMSGNKKMRIWNMTRMCECVRQDEENDLRCKGWIEGIEEEEEEEEGEGGREERKGIIVEKEKKEEKKEMTTAKCFSNLCGSFVVLQLNFLQS